MTSFRVNSLLATTILAGAVLMSSAAVAQSAPATPTDQQDAADKQDGAASEIVVTGSRVSRPNAQSPSPITTIGSEDIRAG